MVVSLITMPVLGDSPNGTSVDSTTTPDGENHLFGISDSPPRQDKGKPGNPGNGPPSKGNGPPGQDKGKSGNNGKGPSDKANGPPKQDLDTDIVLPKYDHNVTSSVDAHQRATDNLKELDTSDGAKKTIDDIITNLNDSAAVYHDQIYVDSRAAFEHKKRAQEGLKTLSVEHEVDEEDVVQNTSELIYDTSNLSARLTVQNAADAFEKHEDEFDNPGQRRQAERHLANAIRALKRANDAVEKGALQRGRSGGSLKSSIQSHQNAINHHRTAVHQANKVFNAVEDATEPRLSLSQKGAFEKDGEIFAFVRANLSDARTYRYGNATVTATAEDGTSLNASPVSLRTETTDVTVSSGLVVIPLGSEPTNATVTVEATTEGDLERRAESQLEVVVSQNDIISEPPADDEYNEVGVRNEETGVSVDVGGEGLRETDIQVTNETPRAEPNFKAGPMVRIQNRTDVDEARVTIPLAEDVDPSEKLSVYKWDPDDSSGWTKINTTIDSENRTATANVSSFSYFSVFRIDEWNGYTTSTITLEDRHLVNESDGSKGSGTAKSLDLMLVVDESGSMGGSRIYSARVASKRFVGGLLEDDRVGLVGYSYGSTLHHGLTTNHDQLNESANSLSAGGSTNTGAGLKEALTEIETNGESDRKPVIILLSDGKTNLGPDPVGIAKEASNKGIEISTVGLGNSVDENELQAIADRTGGDYYHAVSSGDLPDVFQRVAEEQTSTQLRDTNDDGIPDAVAEASPPISTGPAVYEQASVEIDPIMTDSSGDGLLDNESIEYNHRVFEEDGELKLEAEIDDMDAYPLRWDSDGDGLSDHEEVQLGTNPMSPDTSGDGLIDLADPSPTEETRPPVVRYASWDINDLTKYPTTAITITDSFTVKAEPTGSADQIESIKVDQYVDSRFPGRTGWYNRTLDIKEADEDGVFYGTTSFGKLGSNPDRVIIRVTDEDGNQVRINHDVTEDQADVQVLTGSLVASAPARAASRYTLPLRANPYVLGGTAAASGGYLVYSETMAGSAEGERLERRIHQPVPATGEINSWERDGVEITLPSGAEYDEEVLDRNRRHGWEQIKDLPGINDQEDVGEVIEDGERHPGFGEYDVLLNEETALWIHEETIIFGTEVSQTITEEEEEIAEEVEERTEESEKTEKIDREEVKEEIQDGNPHLRDFKGLFDSYTYQISKAVRVTIQYGPSAVYQWHIEIQDDDEDPDRQCALNADDIDMSVDSVSDRSFASAGSEYKEFEGTFEKTKDPVETRLKCAIDPNSVVQTYADDPTDITDGSIGENVSVEFVRERGHELKWPEGGFEKGDASEIGPDIIAYDEENDEWVVIEAKTTTSTDAVGIGLLNTDAYDGSPQLSDDWIENSLNELNSNGKLDDGFVSDLEQALDRGNVRKEVVLVRDVNGAGHRTLTEPLGDRTDISIDRVVGVDQVTIVELQATEANQ